MHAQRGISTSGFCSLGPFLLSHNEGAGRGQWLSQHGPRTGGVNDIWELVRNTNRQTHRRPTRPSSLRANTPSREFRCRSG